MNLRIILYLISCALFVSCSHDDNDIIDQSAPVAVTFSVTLPEAEEVNTRAIYGDKVIKNLTVLVFDKDNKFMDRIDVEEADITASAGNVKFDIILDATSDNRTLHLIANARTADGSADRIDFSGLTTGATEASTIPGLTTKAVIETGDQALVNSITPLIMWGRASLAGVSLTTKVNNIKLLRSVANVNIKKASSGTGLSDLAIHKFAIHNGSAIGKVTAATYNAAVTATPTTGNPATFTAYDYTKAWSETSATPLAYIYERDCTTSNYMSVILHATYNGQAGYYKIALVNGSGTPVNILRNHRYNITITSVNGPGHTSAALAASNGPSNALKATLTVEQTETYPFIRANGQSWMGMTNNMLQVVGAASVSNVDLGTVYVSNGITPVPTVTVGAGLTVSVTSLGGSKYRLVGTLSTHGTRTVRVSCDDLYLDLNISSIALTGLTNDGDSYVMDLIGSFTNWNAWIPNPTTNKHVHLHASNGAASALTGNAGSGMETELNGKYGGKCYLHIHKAAGQKDEVWTGGASGSNTIARKTMVIQ